MNKQASDARPSVYINTKTKTIIYSISSLFTWAFIYKGPVGLRHCR